MKLFIMRYLGFLFFTCFAYAFLIVLGGQLPENLHRNLITDKIRRNDFLQARINEIDNYKDIDILFLGSSHAFRGFDPRIFRLYGYKTFNLGSSSQTPFQSEVLLKAYLPKLRPKAIVLEVFPLMFQSDGIENDINFIIGLPKLRFDMIPLESLKSVKIINTTIYRIFFYRSNNFNSSNTDARDRYVKGGFVETKRKFAPGVGNYYKSDYWSPKVNQMQALDNMVEFAKRNKIKLILVQTPVREKAYHLLKNNAQVDHYFRSKGEYYNFNNLLKLRDSIDFFDGNHLSQSGVEKFDREFITRCLSGKQK